MYKSPTVKSCLFIFPLGLKLSVKSSKTEYAAYEGLLVLVYGWGGGGGRDSMGGMIVRGREIGEEG